MAFNPILSDQTLSYAFGNLYYRNRNRENANGLNTYWGIPVYFVPHDQILGEWGYGGPHYLEGFNYNNSTEQAKGNCTWWCCGRLRETTGKNLLSLMNGNTGHAKYWYDMFTGTKYPNASNAVPGDIIVFTDSAEGHVMFIEKVENGILYISHSAWSYRDYWTNYSCRVNTYNVTDIYAGNTINMYKGAEMTYNVEVVGVIHTGDEPGPGPGPEPGNVILKILPFLARRKNRRGYVSIK